MFIFIHHAEKNTIHPDSLSDIGHIRANNLPDFFTKKRNPNINTPKRILTTDNILSTRTVNMLSIQLKVPTECHKNTHDILKIMHNNKSDHILFCGNNTEIVEIVERLIYKLYYKEMNLKWCKNPEATCNSIKDFSTIWIVDPTDNTLKVYNYFDVFYNQRYNYYDINYSDVSVIPLYTSILTNNNLSRTGYIVNNIKGFLYNLINN